MSAILKFDLQKKKTITFFWNKLSKLHKKDQILHVDVVATCKIATCKIVFEPCI